MAAPKRFPDRDAIADVRAATGAIDAGEELDESKRLAGRVMARREMGKPLFLDLVDRTTLLARVRDAHTAMHTSAVEK